MTGIYGERFVGGNEYRVRAAAAAVSGQQIVQAVLLDAPDEFAGAEFPRGLQHVRRRFHCTNRGRQREGNFKGGGGMTLTSGAPLPAVRRRLEPLAAIVSDDPVENTENGFVRTSARRSRGDDLTCSVRKRARADRPTANRPGTRTLRCRPQAPVLRRRTRWPCGQIVLPTPVSPIPTWSRHR